MSTPVSRRRFVQGVGGAAIAAAPAIRASGMAPAGGRVRLGLIGCGGRGRQLVDVIRRFPDAQFPVLSDVIEPRMDQAAKLLASEPNPQKPEQVVVDDMADTPDTMEASWQFPGFVMHYRYRGFNRFPVIQSRPHGHGICFHGNRATMVLDRSGYELWEDRDPSKSVERMDNPRYWGDGKPGNEVDGPWQRQFVDCVKEGREPPIDFEESHQATVCCHLANIAYRVGRKIEWNADDESIPHDAEAARLLSPPRREGFELPEV